MKIFFIIIGLFILTNHSYGQDLKSVTYKITNVGFISIPPELELQSQKYKQIKEMVMDALEEKYGIEIRENDVIFHQRGLNEGTDEGKSTFARVMLTTHYYSDGDFSKLGERNILSAEEMRAFSNEMQVSLNEGLTLMDQKLIKYYGVSLFEVNNILTVKVSYIRKLINKPQVLVSLYIFYNNDREHILTISYRLEDKQKWASLMDSVLKSFVITNVR